MSAALSRPGTLIRARGREWTVLPGSGPELLMARPVGGLDEEVCGILPAVEPVESAVFPPPAEADVGDFASGLLLRDAARLSTRAAAGPFRAFGRIAVAPRPYQLVPLMMALRLDPARLLIADDVGIGKTVEACLIARELLDRGEIRRIAVLCPPHLAGQWRREMAEKFHIEAELVLSGTIARLERDLPVGVSVFDRHPFTVVSTDFVKSPRRAHDFALKCPEFVIVDEAHGCAPGAGRGRQQRFELLTRIAADKARHMVLVTATPHSGDESAFRSLTSLLDPEFADLPADLEGNRRDAVRRRLARHLVQRRRADIRRWLRVDTPFARRRDKEATYGFSPEYRALFDDILAFARAYASVEEGKRRRRVRYWSALALLRCVSSSPAAAASTLRGRAAADYAETAEEADELGRRAVLDHGDDDDAAVLDFSPGAQVEGASDRTRRRLLDFARRAEGLPPESDRKLRGAVREIQALIADGFRPIVFCRFVDTADYVARALRKALPDGAGAAYVTGRLPPAAREARIEGLVGKFEKYALVCTDCLSEGIDLQEHFDAVVHYDLAWNPTRHEQREGRVDRFGQKRPEVRVVTWFGQDNPVDGVILDVLIRKHKRIRNTLGVTVAVPGSSGEIAETLFEGALFREAAGAAQLSLDFIGDLSARTAAVHSAWDDASARERVNRSRFAQHALKPEAVAAELASVRAAIGDAAVVKRFFVSALRAAKTPLDARNGSVAVGLGPDTPRALRQAMGRDEPFRGRFELPLRAGEIWLGRTSPVVEGVAGWALDRALDAEGADRAAARCGAAATSAVETRTTLLVARFRHTLRRANDGAEGILCEEIVPLACSGPPDRATWLASEDAERLLAGARPEATLGKTAIRQQIGRLLAALPLYAPALEAVARRRAEAQLAAHRRVRDAAHAKGRLSAEPALPVDILGAYVLVPLPRHG